MNSMPKLLTTVFVLITLLCSCGASQPKNEVIYLNQNELAVFPYDLNSINKKLLLSEELREISGIEIIGKDSILCIEDESGVLYLLYQGKLHQQFRFAKPGDYEDVEVVGKIAYVLRSDGRIYRIKKWDTHDPKVKKYNTPLKASNNAEGMCYRDSDSSLLIALKGKPSLKKKDGKPKYRSVYSFDIKKKTLASKPEVKIPLDIFDTLTISNAYSDFSKKIADGLNANGNVSFQPSAIAIHPFTNHLYVLSSTGHVLVVLNEKGSILAVVSLDRADFRQPEGIDFDSEGNMYISNEGRNGIANILSFTYQNI
jgi:uncharacterized protein YjiK